VKPHTPTVFATVVAVLATNGCLHVANSTTEEREASFAKYVDASVGDSLARKFLFDRVVLLTSGVELSISPSETEPGAFYPKGSSGLNVGCATPIDKRGYFLTAAHCLRDESSCYVMFASEGKPRLEKASILWRGNAANNEPDFALLWVPGGIDEVYDWSSDLNRTDAMSVGPNYDDSDTFTVASFAGRIFGRAAIDGGGIQAIELYHTAPAHPGDSGGPLVDKSGKLLAINVSVGFFRTFTRPFGIKYTTALRPNLEWLAMLIEEHAMRTRLSATELSGK